MTQTQVQRQHTKRTEETAPSETKTDQSHADKIKADTDALMDEIDDLLAETDAEAFVNSYVQKGGQ